MLTDPIDMAVTDMVAILKPRIEETGIAYLVRAESTAIYKKHNIAAQSGAAVAKRIRKSLGVPCVILTTTLEQARAICVLHKISEGRPGPTPDDLEQAKQVCPTLRWNGPTARAFDKVRAFCLRADARSAQSSHATASIPGDPIYDDVKPLLARYQVLLHKQQAHAEALESVNRELEHYKPLANLMDRLRAVTRDIKGNSHA